MTAEDDNWILQRICSPEKLVPLVVVKDKKTQLEKLLPLSLSGTLPAEGEEGQSWSEGTGVQ